MAIIESEVVLRCSPEEWAEFRAMVSHGMLFEVIDWIKAGKPTLRPVGRTSSAFGDAILAPNLSMTQVLWERANQELHEVESAIGSLGIQHRSNVVLRYLLENGCPVGHLTGSDLCETHDLDLIRLGIKRGISILEPDGWASSFIRIGSRPLIRFYLEERDRISGLAKDAVYALCESIKESRLRAIALLRWARVDPLGKAPRYDVWDEPESEWTGFPALYLAHAEKAGEILKLLKLQPNVQQWFELLREMATGRAGNLNEILALMPDSMEIIRSNPAQSSWLLTRILRYMSWGWLSDAGQDERRETFCVMLLEAGAKLHWRDTPGINQFRRNFYRSSRKEPILGILKRAAELADQHAKEELIQLINKPKMRELVNRHQRIILILLGMVESPSFRSLPGQPSGALSGRTEQSIKSQKRPEAPRGDDAVSKLKTAGITESKLLPRHKIKRPGDHVLTREMLHAELWKDPATRVASRYGISSSMLARICSTLQVPRPGRGYWARACSWREKNIEALPNWTGKGPDYWTVNPINVKAQRRRKH